MLSIFVLLAGVWLSYLFVVSRILAIRKGWTAMTRTTSARWVCILFAAFLLVTVFSSLVMMADDAGSPAWAAPAQAAKKKNPIAADDKSIAAGKTVYVAQCLKCHGDAGKGDGPSANTLKPKPKDLSDPNITSQTRRRSLLENHHRAHAHADL